MNRWFTTNNENNRPAGQRTFNGLRLFSKEEKKTMTHIRCVISIHFEVHLRMLCPNVCSPQTDVKDK